LKWLTMAPLQIFQFRYMISINIDQIDKGDTFSRAAFFLINLL
jgi:hypothetical protein